MGGRYDNRITEVISERVNIVDLVGEYVQLKRAGRSYKGLCPFHNEKTPSFNVSEDRQFYHCFGCGAGGDAIKFIQQIENLDFLDAVEFLADKLQIDLEEFRVQSGRNSGKQKASLEKRNNLQTISREAAIHFYRNLQKSESAMAYLKDRGLTDETIKKFGLGFAPDGWSNLLDQYRKSGPHVKLLEQAGLIAKSQKKNSYYDYFRNRVMFPIIDIKGKVIGFGGRVMDNSQPKYLNSPETEIFNKSNTLYGLNLAKNALSKDRRVIVTEGYMDVIALHQHGVENAVATLGTALTEQHGHVLSRYADQILICYDADAAGQKAALRSISVLRGVKAKVKILSLGENMDPDDFVKTYGVAAFHKKLDEAMPATEYQLFTAAKDLDLDTDEGRIDYVRRAVEILKEIPEAVERDVYLKHVAADAGVDVDIIKNELKRAKPTSRSGSRSNRSGSGGSGQKSSQGTKGHSQPASGRRPGPGQQGKPADRSGASQSSRGSDSAGLNQNQPSQGKPLNPQSTSLIGGGPGRGQPNQGDQVGGYDGSEFDHLSFYEDTDDQFVYDDPYADAQEASKPPGGQQAQGTQRQPDSLESVMASGAQKKDNDPLRSLERRLLDIAISSRQGYRALMEKLDLSDLHYEKIRSIFEFLALYYRDHEQFDPNLATEYIDLELVKGLKNRIQTMITIEDVHKEIQSNLRWHRKMILEKRRDDVRKERDRQMRLMRQKPEDKAVHQEELRRLIREEQQLNEQISKLVSDRT